MPTKYEIVTASARSYLTPEIEDFIYGMSLLADLSELDQTEEVISLTKEVDKEDDYGGSGVCTLCIYDSKGR